MEGERGPMAKCLLWSLGAQVTPHKRPLPPCDPTGPQGSSAPTLMCLSQTHPLPQPTQGLEASDPPPPEAGEAVSVPKGELTGSIRVTPADKQNH